MHLLGAWCLLNPPQVHACVKGRYGVIGCGFGLAVGRRIRARQTGGGELGWVEGVEAAAAAMEGAAAVGLVVRGVGRVGGRASSLSHAIADGESIDHLGVVADEGGEEVGEEEVEGEARGRVRVAAATGTVLHYLTFAFPVGEARRAPASLIEVCRRALEA